MIWIAIIALTIPRFLVLASVIPCIICIFLIRLIATFQLVPAEA